MTQSGLQEQKIEDLNSDIDDQNQYILDLQRQIVSFEYKCEAQENSLIELDRKIEERISEKRFANEQQQIYKQKRAEMLRNQANKVDVEHEGNSDEKENQNSYSNKSLDLLEDTPRHRDSNVIPPMSVVESNKSTSKTKKSSKASKNKKSKISKNEGSTPSIAPVSRPLSQSSKQSKTSIKSKLLKKILYGIVCLSSNCPIR